VTVTSEQPTAIWNSMPGWGIVADLTPPELLATRRLKLVRKMLFGGLIVVLVLVVAGFAWAFMQKRSASDSLSAEQARTTLLQAQQQRYSDVTRIQSALAASNSRLAGLMAKDVDLGGLITAIATDKPPGLVIGQLGANVTATTSGQSSAANAGASMLDTSGHTHIGTITITGVATSLNDVSTYVDRLQAVKGVVVPYPSTNQLNAVGVQFTVQLTMTDELFTHEYDVSSTGGK
jgi:Tfp pilus assembly protein PilN